MGTNEGHSVLQNSLGGSKMAQGASMVTDENHFVLQSSSGCSITSQVTSMPTLQSCLVALEWVRMLQNSMGCFNGDK